MAESVNKRLYDNTGRRARSADTRKRILDAARAHLVERGYRSTTIAAIAADAGVSISTVYELVGRKPTLARELVELALSGADEPIEGSERDYVAAMRTEPDPSAKLVIYATAIREIQGRLAPLFLALRDAGATEPEAAEVWSAISERRAANMRRVVADLASTGQLRSDIDSPELYVMLTQERGWTPEQFERWLATSWQRLLLDHAAAPLPGPVSRDASPGPDRAPGKAMS
jgi:AcrR family transcriptional regulator